MTRLARAVLEISVTAMLIGLAGLIIWSAMA